MICPGPSSSIHVSGLVLSKWPDSRPGCARSPSLPVVHEGAGTARFGGAKQQVPRYIRAPRHFPPTKVIVIPTSTPTTWEAKPNRPPTKTPPSTTQTAARTDRNRSPVHAAPAWGAGLLGLGAPVLGGVVHLRAPRDRRLAPATLGTSGEPRVSSWDS